MSEKVIEEIEKYQEVGSEELEYAIGVLEKRQSELKEFTKYERKHPLPHEAIRKIEARKKSLNLAIKTLKANPDHS